MATYSKDPKYKDNPFCVDFLYTKITLAAFKTNKDSIEKRVAAFKVENGKLPKRVTVIPGNPQFLSLDKYIELSNRFWKYYYDNKKSFPGFIWINRPKEVIPAPVIVPPKPTDAFLESLYKLFGKRFDTFTAMYNLFRTCIYSYYNNDIYPQGNAVLRLMKGYGLNCSDFSQLGYAAAKKMGYTVRYVHRSCVNGGGHVYLQVKGRELGNNWVNADIAAAASNGSNYSLGKVWCPRGKILAYDPAWLLADDGR
jgi:hypothetical protein